MGFHQLGRDREAQADALVTTDRRVVLLLEGLEDALQGAPGDALARVSNTDLDPLLLGVCDTCQSNPPLRGKLAGIRHEVEEDLGALVGVRLDDGQGVYLVHQLHACLDKGATSLVGRALHQQCDFFQDPGQVHPIMRQTFGRCRGAIVGASHGCHLHDIHHEVQEPVRTSPDHVQESQCSLLLLCVAQLVHQADDAVQRAPQLVRNNSHEPHLPLFRLSVRSHLRQVATDKRDSLDVASLVFPGYGAQHQHCFVRAQLVGRGNAKFLNALRVQTRLQRSGLIAREGTPDEGLRCSLAGFPEHLVEGQAHCFGPRQPSQILGLHVPLVDVARCVHTEDRYARRANEPLEVVCCCLGSPAHLRADRQIVCGEQHDRCSNLERNIPQAIELILQRGRDPPLNWQQVHDTIDTQHDYKIGEHCSAHWPGGPLVLDPQCKVELLVGGDEETHEGPDDEGPRPVKVSDDEGLPRDDTIDAGEQRRGHEAIAGGTVGSMVQ
mmetsp:Transcript_173358/g.550341  ORF Transcript_173358/g.550341 Transcript_173358/m.550341 type:complete len:495 (-) Transcript_173358:630-2114(-)